jgi:hypothetical protein
MAAALGLGPQLQPSAKAKSVFWANLKIIKKNNPAVFFLSFALPIYSKIIANRIPHPCIRVHHHHPVGYHHAVGIITYHTTTN